MRVTVVGAGVGGLSCALELAERGAAVEIVERGESLGAGSCSWFAGGMLAPWCELASGEPMIAALGAESIEWWRTHFPQTVCNGSLVIAHGRDTSDLTTFARRTRQFEWLDGDGLGALELDLAGRFGKALFFGGEAHLDPRAALAALASRLHDLGVPIRFGVHADAEALANAGHRVVDCRGLGARDVLTDLRGVKGEMLLLRLPEISLSRPVRVLHPRMPLYIVPRGDGLFMVGATMIESDAPARISARSMLELLSAAYALHPAFGEAEIVEIGTGVRPAFPDNLPQIRTRGFTVYVNGFYRHGFLLAPALARMTADWVLHNRFSSEVMREDSRERHLA